MASIEYDIRDLYKKAGFIASNFPNLTLGQGGEVVEQVKNLGGTFAQSLSSLGTTLFMPLIIEGFPFQGALISVRGSKNLVTTEVAGSDGKRTGTITELVNEEAFRLRIRGVIVGKAGTYPLAEIRLIHQICRKAGSVSVINALLQTLGIDRMVIQDYAFPGLEGVEDAEAFEINGISEPSSEENILGDIRDGFKEQVNDFIN